MLFHIYSFDTQNMEPMRKQSRVVECRNLEQRLTDALANLRAHATPSEKPVSPTRTFCDSNVGRIAPSSPTALRRVSEISLAESLRREAELQDEVDSLKSVIRDQDKRMTELEVQISELKTDYTKEQHKCRLTRRDMTKERDDLKAELVDQSAKYHHIILFKDKEIERLKATMTHSSSNARSVSEDPVSDEAPTVVTKRRGFTAPIRNSVLLPGLPDVSQYFKTVYSPKRGPLIQVPGLFRW